MKVENSGYNFKRPVSTHQIIVRSYSHGTRSSTKSFSIQADKTNHELNTIIQEFITQQKENGCFDESVMIDMKRGQTHVIITKDFGTRKTKSFTIELPSYTSEEIAREVQKHLCGGESGF